MEVKAWPDETSAKLSVHELPQVWAPIPAEGGITVTEAGRFTRIIDGEPFRYLAYLEYLQGQTRGNHYHRIKQELLYITSGRLLAYYVDLDTGRSLELTLGEGHVIRTGPRLAHAYHAVESAHAIEVAAQPFDPTDTVPYRVYPISDDPRPGQQANELAHELQLRDRIDASHRRTELTDGDTGRAGRLRKGLTRRSAQSPEDGTGPADPDLLEPLPGQRPGSDPATRPGPDR